MVVADIGAGSGVISLMMAKKIGPNGTVLAVDIQEEMLSVLSKRLKQLKVTNVKPVHGTVKSPNLKAGDGRPGPDGRRLPRIQLSVRDAAGDRQGRSNRAGGSSSSSTARKIPNVPIKLLHKMTEAQVKREAGQPEFDLHWARDDRSPAAAARDRLRARPNMKRPGRSETKSPSPFRGG